MKLAILGLMVIAGFILSSQAMAGTLALSCQGEGATVSGKLEILEEGEGPWEAAGTIDVGDSQSFRSVEVYGGSNEVHGRRYVSVSPVEYRDPVRLVYVNLNSMMGFIEDEQGRHDIDCRR